MRVSEILENGEWSREAKERIQTEVKTNLRFKRISDYDFETDSELQDHKRICNFLNCDIGESMIITSDDSDDHDDLVKMTQKIYAIGDFANPPFTNEEEVEHDRLLKLDGFKLVISQSSHDFIKITFRECDINKFFLQILVG